MNALVTGLSGFVGQHLKKRLEKEGIEVKGIKYTNLEQLSDITGNFDYIFNLSAYGNLQTHGRYDLDNFYRSNVLGWWNLLKSTKSMSYKAFINVSTSSAGLDVQTIYSSTKGAMECWCKGFADTFHKPIVSVRPFSLYGEGDSPTHFIPKVINAIKHNVPIGLDGEPVHDWIHIDDFVEALWITAQNANDLKGETVEVGTGVPTNNESIVAIVERIAGKKLIIDPFDNERRYETDSWYARDGRLKRYGWQPKITIFQGLKRLYENT